MRGLLPSKARRDVSRLNATLTALVHAYELQQADLLEMQRRLLKLEAKLGVKWVTDHHYDGEYT